MQIKRKVCETGKEHLKFQKKNGFTVEIRKTGILYKYLTGFWFGEIRGTLNTATKFPLLQNF